MLKIKNLKMEIKLNMLVGFLLICTLAISIVSIISLCTLNNKINDMTSQIMPASIIAGKINTTTSDYRVAQYDYLAANDNLSKQTYTEKLNSLESEISTLFTSYEKLSLSINDKNLLLYIKELWSNYLTENTKIIEMQKNGQLENAATSIIGDSKNIFDVFSTNLENLIGLIETDGIQSSKDSGNTFFAVIIFIPFITIIAFILAVIFSKKVIRCVVMPLREVHDVMNMISDGNLNVHVNYSSKDEFGKLSDDINNLIQLLTDIISDECYLLHEMAEGNFTVISKKENKYIGDYEPILKSLKKINSKLGKTMLQISNSSEQVSIASTQMAQEAQSLTENVTQQSNTIQILLTNINELTAKSVHSLQQTEKVNIDANNVKRQIEQSNAHIIEMTKAMHILSQTSNQISSIINTIEDIAYQTNLLSLNASIEASRAGDAGKGFAVVAREIGKLATQSSGAASSTRNLIQTAISQVYEGNNIAKIATDELSIIFTAINNIVKEINKVNSNCKDQTGTTQQIENGIKMIIETVESTSSSAEESSASSEELVANAESLLGLMSFFKFEAIN